MSSLTVSVNHISSNIADANACMLACWLLHYRFQMVNPENLEYCSALTVKFQSSRISVIISRDLLERPRRIWDRKHRIL
jgi:hypothetical protein